MLSRIFAGAALMLALAAFAAGAGAEGPMPRGLDLRLKTSGEFLKAVDRIVAEGGSDEARGILKLARESYEEAVGHAGLGEFEFAAEDLDDATRKATHAVILSKGSGDQSMRDTVMREEVALLEQREHERSEARLKKGMAEVETFIKTAERLLQEEDNASARRVLQESRTAYAGAKEKIADGDYDGALEGVQEAYRLSTAAVKLVKRSQGDILTFPKPPSDQKEMLAWELRKNDAYAFLASSMVKKEGGQQARLLSDGMSAREDALNQIEAGTEAKALAGLRASTELLIRAIRASGGR